MSERVPLTDDEKAMAKHGFNMRDAECHICNKPAVAIDTYSGEHVCEMHQWVTCSACKWDGFRGRLRTSGVKGDVEYIYCPDCGSDDVGEA